MKKLIIFGGSNGLGLAILNAIYKEYDEILVIDIVKPKISFFNVKHIFFDLSKDNITDISDKIAKADDLIITSGIGNVKPFQNYSLAEINKTISVNETSVIKILKIFYNSLLSKDDKKVLVISSIAGEVSSPLFSVYGASKAALSKLCESLNIELEMSGSRNRITCISPTSFEGSSFNGGVTDINKLNGIARLCIEAMKNKSTTVYIEHDVCLDIIRRYNSDKHEFGISSFVYKTKSNRIDNKKTMVIGYLSGTFDLFHIGHLNLLKRAKKQCDYLIVGVHKSGSWKGKETFIPFEERLAIIESCKYVDEAHESFDEDSDAWEEYHYDKLFVGSDYKGSDRFARYETFFKDKNVEIVYFPYTKGTSSTQLRERLAKKQ